jgi:radical SAM protein with 4Fe4S-binding SPASM domain
MINKHETEQGRICDSGLFPKVVLIDTVSFCDLRCSMCVHKEIKRKKGIMPWQIFTKIIDEIAETDKNIRVWMVFFGEALLLKKTRPSIFDMIAYAKSKGLTDVVLNTNGNLMNEEASRKLIVSGLDGVYAGIDAFTPEVYSKIRVGGDYKKVVKNTLSLLKLKKTLKSSKPDVFVQFVEMDINKEEKDSFIDFWKKNGAKVKIRPKVSWAGSIEASNLILDNKDRWPCHWAMQTMSIINTGKVVTCAVDLDARFIAGDINKSSLKEIWNSSLKELRLLHMSKKFDRLPDNCRNCRDWQSAKADYH